MRPQAIAAAVSLVACWSACSIKGPGNGAGGSGSGGGMVAQNCQLACEFKYPGAVEAYEALKSCLVCRACRDVCGGSCGQADLGCSAQSADCSSCIVSPCALSQQPDTSFTGACAMEGEACAMSSDCVGLNNCVAHCVETTGPSGSSGSSGGSEGTGGSGGAGGATSSSSGI